MRCLPLCPPQMRVLAIGSFDREFSRNRQILRLLNLAGCDVDERTVSVWSSSRAEDARRPLPAVAVRAIWGVLRVAVAMLRAPRPDLVMLFHPSQIDALVVIPIARLRRLPVLLDMFISLHDTMVDDRQLASRHALTGRVTRWLDIHAARGASLVLADTPQHAAALAELTGASLDRFRLLWVGADPTVYQPAPPPTEASRPIVLFYGTYIPLHGTDVIVRAASLLPDGLKVRMIGSGQERRRVENLAASLGAHVEMVDAMPEDELVGEIEEASVCLGVFGTSAKASRVVPNKVFQCLAVGRAVITGDTPAIRTAVGEAVMVVPPGDPHALAAAIALLAGDPERRDLLARSGRELVEARYSDDVLAADLSRYVDEAVAAHQARRVRPVA